MLQNGHTTLCSPLVQYLQYQLQGKIAGNTALFDAQDLHQPHVTIEFLRHCSTILSHLVGSGGDTAANSTQAPAAGGEAFGMNPQQFQEFINAMRSGHTTPAPAASPSQGANTVDKR